MADIYPVDPQFAAKARYDKATYQRLYAESISDPEGFWARQAERLERAQQYGGVAFVLCSFGSVAFYRIPWVVWRDMKGNFGRKYIMPADVEQYRVKIGAPGVPLFLEGLEAQSAEREEHS